MPLAFWLLSIPLFSLVWHWICLLVEKTHLPLGGGCSVCSGSQMKQLLSAEGAANKARHYTKKQNKSESEGWLCFWEKLHHTTARAPSQMNSCSPCTTSQQSIKRIPWTQSEHHHSEAPYSPCITLQPKQQHNAFLTQPQQCWGKIIANTPRQNQ